MRSSSERDKVLFGEQAPAASVRRRRTRSLEEVEMYSVATR